jgi:hypothetical protein
MIELIKLVEHMYLDWLMIPSLWILYAYAILVITIIRLIVSDCIARAVLKCVMR